MKKILTLVALSFFFASGCSTLELNSHKTLGTIAISVDTAMKGWAQYVKSGKATPDQETKVRDLLIKYQESMRMTQKVVNVVRVTSFKKEDIAPMITNVAALAGELTVFIYQFVPLRSEATEDRSP